jgi:hypothetical protein
MVDEVRLPGGCRAVDRHDPLDPIRMPDREPHPDRAAEVVHDQCQAV